MSPSFTDFPSLVSFCHSTMDLLHFPDGKIKVQGTEESCTRANRQAQGDVPGCLSQAVMSTPAPDTLHLSHTYLKSHHGSLGHGTATRAERCP